MKVAYKVSVVICVFNEGRKLLDALRSLCANKIIEQTEVIIVDDCSTDPETRRLLTLLTKHTRYHIVCSPVNLGLSHSRNLGFENASTPYVLPLDADDTFPPEAIDIIYQAFLDHPEAGFIAGNYLLNKPGKNQATVVDCSMIATNELIDIKKLAGHWSLLGTSPCKKATWELVNGYALKYSYSVQDVDFWIRVLKKGIIGHYLDQIIYSWNQSASGMNMNFDRIDMTRLLEDHRDFYRLIYTDHYVNNAIFEAYYPYKEPDVLMAVGKKYFFQLRPINKLRTIAFFIKTYLTKLSAL